jgi:hypothetical protein
MERPQEMGNRNRTKGPGTRRTRLSLFLGSWSLILGSWLTGCAGENRVADDPLIGGPAPTPPAKLASAAAAGPPAAGAPVPPLPPTGTWAFSTASLAEGKPVPPLEGGRDLRIRGKASGTLATQTWDGPGKAMDREPNGAVLRNGIEPVAATGSANGGGPVQNLTVWDDTGSGSGKTATYEELQKQLTERGVDWYRQEKVENGVKFVCTTRPDPKNPGKIRTYEATAASERDAAKAVLEQIEKEP